jgi:uncharacterized membrane protein
MSPTTTHQPPATQTARRLRRLAAVLTAVIAAVVLWAIAVHAAGIDLRSPGFGHSQKPAALNPGTVAVVSGLAGLAAWACSRFSNAARNDPARSGQRPLS